MNKSMERFFKKYNYKKNTFKIFTFKGLTTVTVLNIYIYIYASKGQSKNDRKNKINVKKLD